MGRRSVRLTKRGVSFAKTYFSGFHNCIVCGRLGSVNFDHEDGTGRTSFFLDEGGFLYIVYPLIVTKNEKKHKNQGVFSGLVLFLVVLFQKFDKNCKT